MFNKANLKTTGALPRAVTRRRPLGWRTELHLANNKWHATRLVPAGPANAHMVGPVGGFLVRGLGIGWAAEWLSGLTVEIQ